MFINFPCPRCHQRLSLLFCSNKEMIVICEPCRWPLSYNEPAIVIETLNYPLLNELKCPSEKAMIKAYTMMLRKSLNGYPEDSKAYMHYLLALEDLRMLETEDINSDDDENFLNPPSFNFGETDSEERSDEGYEDNQEEALPPDSLSQLSDNVELDVLGQWDEQSQMNEQPESSEQYQVDELVQLGEQYPPFEQLQPNDEDIKDDDEKGCCCFCFPKFNFKCFKFLKF